MAKFLTADENTRLSNYWKRRAYEYTMKAYAGDQGVDVEMIRIKAMNDILQMLGYDAKFSTDYAEMYRVGDELYGQGFRRSSDGQHLVKEVTHTMETI